MKEALFTVENFKFSLFDTAPRPDIDTAYILFREGNNFKNMLIITSLSPVLSAQVRAGGYNKKVIVSLRERESLVKREIADEQNMFKFLISVQAIFKIKDIKYVYINQLENIESSIAEKINEIINQFQKKFCIENYIELESALKEEVLKKLDQIDYLQFTKLEIDVDLDERAKKIINSQLDAWANSTVMQNEGEFASKEVEEKLRLDVQKIEAEKKVEEKKGQLLLEKAKIINNIKEELGEEYPLFLAYTNNEISSNEFGKRLQENANYTMRSKIDMLKEIVDLDILAGPTLERVTLKTLGETVYSEQKEQGESIEEDNQNNIVNEEPEVL